MKRTDLVRHLESSDCVFVREGGRHTIYKIPQMARILQSRVIER